MNRALAVGTLLATSFAAAADLLKRGFAVTTSASRRSMFLGAGMLATLIAFIGFWPTYFGPLLLGTLETTVLIHVHAVVQIGWLALFIAQALLVRSSRRDLHVKLGRLTFAFSIVVMCAAIAVSFDTFGRHVALGESVIGQRRLFGFLRDVIGFTSFILAGWLFRHKPETHKRLMIVATVILVMPAVGRMKFLGSPVSLSNFMLVWPLPIYALMVHEYLKQRRVHPVYLIGIAAMLAMRLVLPLRTSETWMTISSWFVPLYQTAAVGG